MEINHVLMVKYGEHGFLLGIQVVPRPNSASGPVWRRVVHAGDGLRVPFVRNGQGVETWPHQQTSEEPACGDLMVI